MIRIALLLSLLPLVTFTYARAISVGDVLEKKLTSIFDEVKSLPLSMSKRGIDVRVKWDGPSMLAVAETKFTPHHPREFRNFLENFASEFPKVNSMVKNVDVLKKEGEREGVKSILNFPFPLANRLMIHWKYTRLDRAPDEHLLMISEQGNDELLEQFHSSHEKKHYVLGRTFLCAYWIKPVYEGANVVGANIRYAFSGDTGGIIPKFIQDMVGPKTALDSVEGLIRHVESKKTKNSLSVNS